MISVGGKLPTIKTPVQKIIEPEYLGVKQEVGLCNYFHNWIIISCSGFNPQV